MPDALGDGPRLASDAVREVLMQWLGHVVEPMRLRGRGHQSRQVAIARPDLHAGADEQQGLDAIRISPRQARCQVPAVGASGKQIRVRSEDRVDGLPDRFEHGVGRRRDRR